jgi:hypothetical protein
MGDQMLKGKVRKTSIEGRDEARRISGAEMKRRERERGSI